MRKIIFITIFFASYISADETFFECELKSKIYPDGSLILNISLDKENNSATLEQNYTNGGTGSIYQAKPSFTADEMLLTYDAGSFNSTIRINRSTLEASRGGWRGDCKIIKKSNEF